MPIELGGIVLDRIHRVSTLENAGYTHHRVPGLQGHIVQDQGRDALRLQIEGIFYGPKALESLTDLRKKYLDRVALDLLAEITGQLYASQVIIDRMEVVQSAGLPDQFSYTLTVTEYVEPPPAARAGAAGLDDLAALEAGQLMDVMALPDALSLGSIPEVSNPFEPLKKSLSPVQDAAIGVLEAAASLRTLLQQSNEE